MIKVYIGHNGYQIVSEKYTSNREFTYHDHYEPIDGCWYSFITAVQELKEKTLSDHLCIYNNSRFIEELKGKCPPLTKYASKCLVFARQFLQDFSWVELSKIDEVPQCQTSVMNSKN